MELIVFCQNCCYICIYIYINVMQSCYTDTHKYTLQWWSLGIHKTLLGAWNVLYVGVNLCTKPLTLFSCGHVSPQKIHVFLLFVFPIPGSESLKQSIKNACIGPKRKNITAVWLNIGRSCHIFMRWHILQA